MPLHLPAPAPPARTALLVLCGLGCSLLGCLSPGAPPDADDHIPPVLLEAPGPQHPADGAPLPGLHDSATELRDRIRTFTDTARGDRSSFAAARCCANTVTALLAHARQMEDGADHPGELVLAVERLAREPRPTRAGALADSIVHLAARIPL